MGESRGWSLQALRKTGGLRNRLKVRRKHGDSRQVLPITEALNNLLKVLDGLLFELGFDVSSQALR
jgi:hypothetical protein